MLEAQAVHQIIEILQEHSDMRFFSSKISGFLEYLITFSLLVDLFLKTLKAQNQFEHLKNVSNKYKIIFLKDF